MTQSLPNGYAAKQRINADNEERWDIFELSNDSELRHVQTAVCLSEAHTWALNVAKIRGKKK